MRVILAFGGVFKKQVQGELYLTQEIHSVVETETQVRRDTKSLPAFLCCCVRECAMA
jgi:hypothetical protein